MKVKKFIPKQSDMNRQEFTISDSGEQNSEEDQMMIQAYPYWQVKPMMNLKKDQSSCKRLYVKEARRFQRQPELFQTREEVQQNTQTAFTPVRSQGEWCPRVLFDQDNQSQNPRQD